MSLPWFRMYSEFASDPVIQALAFEDQRHYVVLLCLKCNGTLDRDITATNRNRIIYRGLGLDPATAEEAKRRLCEMALIDDNWNPIGWDKRQYKSDLSTQRVRKSRKTKKPGNVSETLHGRFGNGPDTDTDTDTVLRTAADAAPDEIIWSAGVKLITGSGVSEPSARAFLGGLRKRHDDGELAAAVWQCMAAKPIDPRSWLKASLGERKRRVVV